MISFLCILLVLFCVLGIIECLLIKRVIDYMRATPEAAELIAKHVIAPMLSGSGVQEAREVFGNNANQSRPS